MMPRTNPNGMWETYGGAVSSGGGRPKPTEETKPSGKGSKK